MCGYHDEAAPASGEDLLHQFGEALQRRRGERIAKVYTSGSFFDDGEVPPGIRARILGELSGAFGRVVIESRPVFLTEGAVSDALSSCPGLEVALGLESASPRVLERSVRKGFTFSDYADGATLVRRLGGRVRTYLLLKPPFLTEREAVEDAVASALRAAPLSDTVSLNPVNVQRGTLVDRLWRRGLYRPPWLWSAAEALLRVRRGLGEAAPGARLVCAPSGAGRRRGPQNCGGCDASVLSALEEFSVSQDVLHLEKVLSAGCSCMPHWRQVLDAGAFAEIMQDALKPR